MNRKAMEMTINTIIAFAIGLVLLAVGIYLIYTKVLKPSESATTVLDCSAQNGVPYTSCSGCKGVCLQLQGGNPYCCIEKLGS